MQKKMRTTKALFVENSVERSYEPYGKESFRYKSCLMIAAARTLDSISNIGDKQRPL